MDNERSVGAGRRWNGPRPGPGGRSGDNSIAEDGGQDTRQWMCRGENSVGETGGASVQPIYNRRIHTSQRKNESAFRCRHIGTSERINENDK